ncbi:lipoprotein [Paraferrimonas sp. SM1919]|nr:lipoprotein [Paraferrimonas sp. SM1919]
MKKNKLFLFMMLASLWLSACGQKGPLYNPEPQQPNKEAREPEKDQG